VTLILDTGAIIALYDRRDPLQPSVERILRDEPGDLVIPGPVSAEIDYLLGERLGRRARTAFLEDLAESRFLVLCPSVSDYHLIRTYNRRYADLDVGLADLSVVLMAHRHRTRRVMTVDMGHFRALQPIDGGAFVLLPMDA
jgi:predicted nucleic acid-binding protein